MKPPAAKPKKPEKKDVLDLEKVEVIASMGLTDDQIAVVLDISVRTLNYWKKKPGFGRALKRGKLKADFAVTQSLYRKAIGYEAVDKEGERVKIPGETTACIFWLKNRQPDKWRDRQDVSAPGVEKALSDLYEVSNKFLPVMARGAKTRSDETR